MLPNLPNVPPNELKELRRTILSMLQLEDDIFPGSQPVSFERKHLSNHANSLFKKAFYAAEKTDGVRYMLLILKSAAYTVDRNFAMKALPPMYFPSLTEGQVVDQTLLDGELIVDDAEDGGLRHRFLAYDACCVNGRNVMAESLLVRLMCLRREVLGPRFSAAQSGHDFGSEPFLVEQKDFFAMQQVNDGVLARVASADLPSLHSLALSYTMLTLSF